MTRGQLSSENIRVFDKPVDGRLLDQETVRLLFWGFFSAQGMNALNTGKQEDKRKREARMDFRIGVDDMQAANYRLIQLVDILQERHGFDATALFEKRVAAQKDSISRLLNNELIVPVATFAAEKTTLAKIAHIGRIGPGDYYAYRYPQGPSINVLSRLSAFFGIKNPVVTSEKSAMLVSGLSERLNQEYVDNIIVPALNKLADNITRFKNGHGGFTGIEKKRAELLEHMHAARYLAEEADSFNQGLVAFLPPNLRLFEAGQAPITAKFRENAAKLVAVVGPRANSGDMDSDLRITSDSLKIIWNHARARPWNWPPPKGFFSFAETAENKLYNAFGKLPAPYIPRRSRRGKNQSSVHRQCISWLDHNREQILRELASHPAAQRLVNEAYEKGMGRLLANAFGMQLETKPTLRNAAQPAPGG